MSKAVVRGGFDTWANSAKPSQGYAGAKYLTLDSGEANAFVYLKSPVPRNATVTSAKLIVAARGASSGSRTLTVRLLAQSWKARTLTWATQPSTFTGATVTKSISTLADGDEIELDVTSHLQSIANGAGNFGWLITTSSTTAHKLYGFDAGDHKPRLEVEWTTAPAAPTSLTPSESLVSLAKPVLQMDYTDVSGNTTLASVQAQVGSSTDTGSPSYVVNTSFPEIDLSTTTYPGLAAGSTAYWRCRVKDGGGLWSEWSDWTYFTRQNKGAVTITNPAASPNNYVTEFTPPIVWSFSGTQTAYRVRVYDGADQGKELHDSGKITGSATSYTIPKKVLKDGRTYTVEVRIFEDGFEGTPGDPAYSLTSRTFTVVYSGTVTGVGSLIAAPDGANAWNLLTWTRGTAPDSFTILRDGVAVEVDLSPADVLVSGGDYAWRDYGAVPHKAHTYEVTAVVNGVQSSKTSVDCPGTAPVGLWLIDPEVDTAVVLADEDAGTWNQSDEAATYRPVGGSEVVRIVTGMSGLEGSLSGLLVTDAFGRSLDDQEADLLAMKENPSREFRLVVGSSNLEVLLGNVRISPTPLTRRGQIVKNVAFDFWQVGDLGFTPRL